MQLEEIKKKREDEKKTIYFMIDLYCKKKHKNKKIMCKDCYELYEYASNRIDRCPFMETKTFCSTCKVHCYGKKERERIRNVMKFSGPRMIFYSPRMAFRHGINTLKNKR